MKHENKLADLSFVRINDFVGRGKLIPVSKSTWWAGVKSGRFPQPVSGSPLGGRITVWRLSDIHAFVNSI